MIRSVLGFALFAVVVWLVLKQAFGILGTLIGLAFTVSPPFGSEAPC